MKPRTNRGTKNTNTNTNANEQRNEEREPASGARPADGGQLTMGSMPARKGANIASRLVAFGSNAVGIAEALPDTPAGRHIAGQLLRSGTSAGANYEEARGAQSRADFVHKVALATKELRESLYWITLVSTRALAPLPDNILREADELIAILVASAHTARRK